MNRRDEYRELMAELSREPSELNFSVQNAVNRAKGRRRKRFLSGFGSLAGVCAAFVLMVNTSPAFALSCREIPVLKDIAAAVAWSPSLKQAIVHNYIQYVGQRQTVDGVTVTLESVIADAQQIVVFYRADGVEDYHHMTCDLKDMDGTSLDGYGVTSGTSQNSLNRFEIHFMSDAPPQDLILETDLFLSDENGEEVKRSKFSFSLHLDPQKTAKQVEIPVNQWVELDSQRLLVEKLELSPTKTALYLDDDSANTAWLRGLDFYFTDKKGNRYDKKDSSVSAMGRSGTEGFYTYYHQSLYFIEDLNGLTLHITGADWLDKDEHTVQIDLSTGQADWLPEYILDVAVRDVNYVGDGVQKTLEFTTTSQPMCLDDTYYDPQGGEHRFNGGGSRGAYTDNQGVYHFYRCDYMLKDYPFDQVTVELSYTHVTQLDEPLNIPVP